MYSGDKLDKQTFGKTLVWGEVGSMVSEAKVHDELKLGSDKPQFFYKRADGKDDHIDISDYEKQHGIKGLYDFLDTAKPARTNQEPYGVYYQKNYKAYADRFTQDRPNALMTIEKWVKSGHKAEDI